jgi:hypothetical protein
MWKDLKSPPDIGLEVGLLSGMEQPSVSRCLGTDSKQSSSEDTLLALLTGPDFSVIFLGVCGNSGISERLSFPQKTQLPAIHVDTYSTCMCILYLYVLV